MTGLVQGASVAGVPVITIDGPVGSGKGTISSRLAHKLGWHLLDSGALYRLVAVAAMDKGIDPNQTETLAELAEGLDIRFEQTNDKPRSFLAGIDVSARLRKQKVSSMASMVAAIPAVRTAIVARQRAFLQMPGLVADGRDMGTVIFPEAQLKIFLTASAEERAQRRYKQLKEKGKSVNLSRLFKEIKARDKRDMERTVAPLKPAQDAVIIDSTEYCINEVVEMILALHQKSTSTD